MDPPSATPLVMDSIFNAADADLLLRSSDNVHFAVYRAIFRLISTVFKDMLALPQSPDARPLSDGSPHVDSANVDATHVDAPIQMFEDADSLRLLLQFCYPRSTCEEPKLLAILDIKRAATLAHKYDIDFLREKAENALIHYSDTAPALAFAVSWRFGYNEPLRAAARRSLDIPSFFKVVAGSDDSLEVDEVPATALVHLLRYQLAVREQLEGLLVNSRDKPLSWIEPTRIEAQLLHGAAAGTEPMCTCSLTVIWFRVDGLERGMEWRVYSWWWDYVYTVIALMQGEHRPPIDVALGEPFLECLRSASGCNTCNGAAHASRVLTTTRNVLQHAIEDRLRAIPLKIVRLA